MTSRLEPLTPWASVVYGIDDASDPPIIVRARRKRGRLQLERIDGKGRESRPGEPMQNNVHCGFANASTVCAMPPGPAMAVWLKAPLASRRRTLRVLPTLLDMAMPYPLDECSCAFGDPVSLKSDPPLPISPDASGSGMAALAVAARISDIKERLSGLEQRNLVPEALDHEGLALWFQACRELPLEKRNNPHIRLVVHVRGNKTVLVIGFMQVFWSAHRLSENTPEALIRILRLQLDSASGGRYTDTPRTWIWSGDAPPAWKTEVENALPGTSLSPPDPQAFLARALATRALTAGPLQFNLLRNSLEHPAAAAIMRSIRRRRAIFIALAAAGLMLLNASLSLHRQRLLKQTDLHFMQRIHQVTGWPVAARGENALLVAERELESRRAELDPLARSFSPSLLDPLGAILEKAEHEDITLNTLMLSLNRIRLQGHTPSRAAAGTLSQEIKSQGYEAAAVLEPLPDDAYKFSIEGIARETF